jgi:hypothetical protein
MKIIEMYPRMYYKNTLSRAVRRSSSMNTVIAVDKVVNPGLFLALFSKYTIRDVAISDLRRL